MAGLLPCVEIEPSGEVRGAVVWMHGLGADGHDFEPIVPHLGLPDGHGVRFVFPNAPSIPVTLNGGMVMPAWYDIRELDLRREHDEQGILVSAASIEALLAREKERGVPAERIVVAGFSQGGAMALHVGLRYPERLAGILALSCYLVRAETVEEERSPASLGLPIFQAHGSMDPMVPLPRGEEAHRRLLELGHPVEWHTWPMGHQVCLEEIEAAGRFLVAKLGLNSPA